MKRIKKKCLNLLLSLLLCLSVIPMTIFSNDSNTVHASTGMTLEEMYNSVGYKAIEYLGYDPQGILRENGWTFNRSYTGKSLRNSSYWSSCRCRWNNKTLDYASGSIVPSKKADVYRNGGANCSTYCQYFVFGYLVDQLGYKLPGLNNAHYQTINNDVGGWASVYRIWNTCRDYVSRYPQYMKQVVSRAYRNASQTAQVADTLEPGDIVAMGTYSSSDGNSYYQHAMVYIGKYNGIHFFAHSGVEGRGPELIALNALVSGLPSTGTKASSDTDGDENMPCDYINYDGTDPIKEVDEGTKASGDGTNYYIAFAFRVLQPFGYLKLNKTIGSGSELCEIAGSEFYTLEGAEYTVYTNAACTNPANDKDGNAAVLITDETGESNTIALMTGTYYVKETKAPKGFEIDDEVHAVTISASNSESSPALIEVEDDAAFDPFGLTLSKTNSQGTVIAGAQFTLDYYNADYSSVAEAEENQAIRTWTFETDETGYFRYADRYKVYGDDIFKDEDGEPCLIDGTYVLKETLTPEHYATADPILMKVTGNTRTLYSADGKTVLSTASTDVAYDLNEIALGYLMVYKESSDSEFEAAHSVEGAEYTVFSDSGCTNVVNIYGTDTEAIMIIGEDNYSNKVELLPGTYYVKETKAAEGYELDETIYTITVPEYDTVTVNSQDVPQSGYVTVTKSSTDESYLEFHSVAGAVYTVYKDEQLTHSVGTLTVSEDGVSNTMTLNIGTYYIKETTPAPGYLLDETVYTVTVTDDQTVNTESDEKPANGYLLAVKGISRDSDLVDLASDYYDATGTVINVYTDENCTTQAITFSGEAAQLIVGDDGQTTNTVELKAGVYWLKEQSTTHPFFLSDEVVMVEVKAGETAETTEAAYNNRPKFDMIKVLLYKLNDEDAPLGNVEFTVRYYSEKISDIEDVSNHSAKASWILKTDDNKGTRGQLIFDEEHKVSGDELWKDADGNYVLLPGTYYFEESTAPDGYVACSPFIINLTMDDIDGVTQKFNAPVIYNAYQTVTVIVQKVDKDTGEAIPQGYGSFEGAQYQILYWNPLTAAYEDKGIITLDETGKGSMGDLMPGTYRIIEIKAPDGYILNDEPIDLKAGITEVNIDHIEYTVQSEEEVTEISLLKVAVDEEGNKKPLAGATLILSDSQGTEIERWVSEETAHVIKGLKIGETYTVTEEGSVEGYLPLEEPLTFTVTDDTYAVVYEIRNDPVPKNKMFVAKVDEVGNPVKGAILQILEGETVIYEFTSGVEPVEVSDYLECGKEYVLREIETPYGYETSLDVAFTATGITTAPQTITMVDERIELPVAITKYDATNMKELPGAHLEVRDEEGNIIDAWISTTEQHEVWLFVGHTYTLTETTAPHGYAVAETIEFTVNEEGEVQQQVMMLDKPIDVPDTGDRSDLPLYIAMMTFSLFGMAFMLLVDQKKNLML